MSKSGEFTVRLVKGEWPPKDECLLGEKTMSELETGEWEIWIDNVCGELAMTKTDLARRKVLVVEAEVFEKIAQSEKAWIKRTQDEYQVRCAMADVILKLREEVERLKALTEPYLTICAMNTELRAAGKGLCEALKEWLTWEREQIEKEGGYVGTKINMLIKNGREALATHGKVFEEKT